MKFLRYVAFALPILIGVDLAAGAAFAQAATETITTSDAGSLLGSSHVTIPWGAYVSAILSWSVQFIVAIAVALAAWASRTLPSWLASLIQEYLTQKRIERAVNYGVTQVDTIVAGRTLDIPATNLVVAAAEQYMLKLAPQAAAQLGERLKPMIAAQIAKIGVAPAKAVPNVPLPVDPLPQLRK